MNKNNTKPNAEDVLASVKSCINDIRHNVVSEYDMYDICDELNIFDWWVDYLTLYHLLDMSSFLTCAISLGFTGYVCFKVGDSGCANGMWAYKNESVNGHSPDGDFIYRSFSPDYIYWSIKLGNTYIPRDEEYNSAKTFEQLKRMIEEQGFDL